MLPRITVRIASSVNLEGIDGRESLVKSDNGWTLPNRDLSGEFTLIATIGPDEQERRRIRFYGTPASEDFKPCTDPNAWIAEGMGGTETLSNSMPFAAFPADEDFQGCCERVAHLGGDVGSFATTHYDAAWKVSHFAGKWIGARGPRHKEQALPANQVVSAHARRRWRKMLFDSVPAWSDPGFDQARLSVKRGSRFCSGWPKRPLPIPLHRVVIVGAGLSHHMRP